MKRKAERVVPELLERGVTRSREGLRGVAQSRAGEALEKLAELEAQVAERNDRQDRGPSWKLWKGPSREPLEPRGGSGFG